jgi:hypothetical protein
MMTVTLASIEERFQRFRGQEAILEADAAAFYRVSLRAVRAAVGRDPRLFTENVVLRLRPEEAGRPERAAKPARRRRTSSPSLAFTWPAFMTLSYRLKGSAAAKTSVLGIRMLGAA